MVYGLVLFRWRLLPGRLTPHGRRILEGLDLYVRVEYGVLQRFGSSLRNLSVHGGRGATGSGIGKR
jgi:hypothetical protein